MRVLLITTMMLVALTTGLMALTVEGTVVDAETGAVIDGATVRFVSVNTECENLRGNGNGNGNGNGSGNGSGGGNGSNAFTTITDANGHYVLTDLPAGLFNVIARKTGAYPAVRFEGVELTEDTIYDFELIPGNCDPQSRFGSSLLKFGK